MCSRTGCEPSSSLAASHANTTMWSEPADAFQCRAVVATCRQIASNVAATSALHAAGMPPPPPPSVSSAAPVPAKPRRVRQAWYWQVLRCGIQKRLAVAAGLRYLRVRFTIAGRRISV